MPKKWKIRFRGPYATAEMDLAEPLRPLVLTPEQNGAHVLVRFKGRPVGRFWVERPNDAAEITPERLRCLAASCTAQATARAVHDVLAAPHADAPPPTPSLSIAVCTRDRPKSLERCLSALQSQRASRGGEQNLISLLIVDNAPSDDETWKVVQRHEGVAYLVERVPGLNIARNRAVAEARTDFIAFIDDDAVVDVGWLAAFAEAVRVSPRAVAFTGPVLPMVLETEAQLRFERAGGFGEEILFEMYDRKRWGDRLHPVNAGRMGTGTNMVFSVPALKRIGGFDEALDTGPPLPGGGDLDILLRIVASGGRLVYSPGQLVFHEHRREMRALRAQHASWGMAMAVLLSKNARDRPQDRGARREFRLWWLRRMARRLLRSFAGRDPYPASILLAEAVGALKGSFGEYDRSRSRIDARKRETIA